MNWERLAAVDIVDEYVHATFNFRRDSDGARRVGLRSDISFDVCGPSLLSNLGAKRFTTSRKKDGCAFLREPLDHSSPKSASATSDDGNFTL